ncbi:DUF3592 domain-containing protein [Kitasatospora sp. GAS204B]|uniref:DUF3592 domain-containing protein n=1 Tax=unclassified Kitasatospora TaxID=2633591 RepID=UPI0024737C08|nr:DUF3592 domain-containing protein [Kitasatospora sp. GAS204B]
MFALLAFNLLFGGVLAYLAGAAGLAQNRRLRQTGIAATALVKRRPEGRPLLQFATREGLVMEVFSPVELRGGPEVPVRYDPADPRLVLVQGRERRAVEYGFLGAGAAIVLTALTLAVLSL